MAYLFLFGERNEAAHGFVSKRGKQVVIAVAILVLFGIFYIAGNTLTTYATYNKNLEQQLNNTKLQLSQEQIQAQQCQESLNSVETQIEGAKTAIDQCGLNLNLSYIQLDVCKSEKSDINTDLNDVSSQLDACIGENALSFESFNQLVRNSIKAICCSYGDVQSGSVRGWNITNNTIKCSGAYTVNCTSGETDY